MPAVAKKIKMANASAVGDTFNPPSHSQLLLYFGSNAKKKGEKLKKMKFGAKSGVSISMN